MFANLFGNAVNYLDPARPGHIEIGSHAVDSPTNDRTGWAAYYAKDNGRGDFGLNGDRHDDGDTDAADYVAWQQQVGSTTAAVTAQAVREPHAVAMVLAAHVISAAARRIAPTLSCRGENCKVRFPLVWHG